MRHESNGHARSALLTLFLTLCVMAAGAETGQQGFGQTITVYKSATCGCCQGWVDYLKTQGFHVESHDVQNLDEIKAQNGLTDGRLKSCHTAIVDGYVVEGHVPADDIRRLLAQRPQIVGISAPGMPSMSPGMNSLEPKGYDVLSFDARGKIEVFSRY